MSELNTFENIIELPVIPLRGLVVFPEMVLHFDVGRKKSIAAIKSAMNSNQKVFLVCQRDASVDDPSVDELFATGVVCSIKQMTRIPGSENLRVFVEGLERGYIVSATQTKPYINSAVMLVEETNSAKDSRESLAYLRALRKEFEKYATLMPKISNDVIAAILSIDDGGKLADYICSNTILDYSEKQSILE
ncbi:MAG: LON peptidase substrate-binding domain-containing protein, partial [Eubacterium sp.]|nr:LON peptidase substrate-binding domain-containing protein [Eubacterium sp.]